MFVISLELLYEAPSLYKTYLKITGPGLDAFKDPFWSQHIIVESYWSS